MLHMRTSVLKSLKTCEKYFQHVKSQTELPYNFSETLASTKNYQFTFGAEQGGRKLNKRRKNERNKPFNKKNKKARLSHKVMKNVKKNM